MNTKIIEFKLRFMKDNKWLILYFVILIASFAVLKRYVFNIYLIESYSMNNTLFDGDKILINKFNKDFKRNDVLIFSKFNDTYIKRCIGLPGDTIQILNGRIYANKTELTFPGSIINTYGSLGRPTQANSSASFNVFVFDYYKQNWTQQNFGPYIIPRKGRTIVVTPQALKVFGEIISAENTGVLINKLIGNQYTFKKNYYFMVGDNRLKSKDSRMFGPIAEQDIIGKASYILYSKKNIFNGVYLTSVK